MKFRIAARIARRLDHATSALTSRTLPGVKRTNGRRRLPSLVLGLALITTVTILAWLLPLLARQIFGIGAVDEAVVVTGARRLNDDIASQLDNYPDDAFTLEQWKDGAVVLHFIGIMYMFIGLAVVCDEFFVPALEVITEKCNISDDVAGATFMAAGGSAPELFTSFIGTFVSVSNVGFGTIVGSAVFNVLFVIGMCAMFSKSILELTWWPLFRDSLYYAMSLGILSAFFFDNVVEVWEAAVLFGLYVVYVLMMSQNTRLYAITERALFRWKHGKAGLEQRDDEAKQTRETVMVIRSHSASPRDRRDSRIAPSDGVDVPHGAHADTAGDVDQNPTARRNSTELKQHAGTGFATASSIFKAGVLRVMMHAPKSKVPAKKRFQLAAMSIVAVRSGSKSSNQATAAAAQRDPDIRNSDEMDNISRKQGLGLSSVESHTLGFNPHDAPPTPVEPAEQWADKPAREPSAAGTGGTSTKATNPPAGVGQSSVAVEAKADAEEEEEEVENLLEWPETRGAQIWYCVIFPLVAVMVVTIPDSRRPNMRKWFVVSFIMSIFWIGAFSFLMVWWATVLSVTLSIPTVVTGLTLLAAGTSVPDLLSSVIVARQGLGDMAVSSSIGSNIFDILVGLPIPWLAYTIAHGGSISVGTQGLKFSVLLLVGMLLAVIATIALSGWRMTKLLGACMFVLYGVFVALNLMAEFDVFDAKF